MGWTYSTVFANNVKDAFKKKMLPRRYYKDSNHTELIESEIIHLEFYGNNAFLLEKFSGEYYATSYLLKYSKRHADFGYKDMGFWGAGNSYLASKKMLNLVKKYCGIDSEYANSTLVEWEKHHNKLKEIKNKIKKIKVGTVIIFPNCNYGGRGKDYRWTVTAINGNNVYFDNAKLRNWKKQYFEIVA